MTDAKKGIKREGLWLRIQKAYGGKNAPEIARLLNRTKQSVYRWRDGEVPGVDTLAEIAKSRNVSLHWLLLDKGPEKIGEADQVDSAAIPRQANEVQSDSESEDSAELRLLLKEYFQQAELVTLFHSLSPRERSQLMAFAKGIADPDSIPLARAVAPQTEIKKKAS